MRATSTSPAGPLRRSLRVLKKSGNPKPEPKQEPKIRNIGRKAPSGRGQRVNTSPPIVPPTVDAIKSQPLILHDTTGDATHHRPSRHQLKRPVQGDSGKRNPDVIVESEPDEDLGRVSVLPPSAALGSGGLLGDAEADSTECSPASVYPPTATLIGRQFVGHARAAETLTPAVTSQSEDDTASVWSAVQAVDAIGGQLHVSHGATEDTTHRPIPGHHFTWSARHRRGDAVTRSYSPEVAIKNEPEENLTHLGTSPSDAASTSRLSSGDTREPTFSPEYEEEILYLPKVDPALKYGGIVSQDGDTEIPLFVISRREKTNQSNTEAPTASPPTVRIPSLSMVTQQTSTMDCFTSMFPWAKYSVELNKPTNVPYTLTLTTATREPTPVLKTEEDFDATEGGSESESGKSDSVWAGSIGGSKRTWDEASDEDEESTDGEEVEEPRPQRRRKLLWA